ncbi:MAG TPA: hypothetical protein VHV83_13630, partial [Armatimonadota bacterium]|nr:hypothetical protein [Armatimonadota bacterium]
VALGSNGTPQLAWFNRGTGIQSFAEKPTAMLRLAATQSPEIHRRYGTNACFLDVCSAVTPWFHVDMRAGEQGAGTFQQVWSTHQRLWQYLRDTHGGPVFGEGSNHWYWSGYLDGAEAQFGRGWPANQGMSAPVMVDFDLLKVHPLQLNHGMGYFDRWWDTKAWGETPPMIVLDQYRMQEVAYGHAGFPYYASAQRLALTWLEYGLLTPVTERTCIANPVEITYLVDGKWVDTTAAAKANAWQRVRIKYANGVVVTANSQPESLVTGDLELPQYGWSAIGGGITAYTAQRNGKTVDYAETADSIFANARDARDWPCWQQPIARPQIADFRQIGPRTFRVTYRWQVLARPERTYRCFVHFTQKNDGKQDAIQFQQDHDLATPTLQWGTGSTIIDGPHTIVLTKQQTDGDYDWRIGLYADERASLEGVKDNDGRVILGTLSVRDGGKTITFTPKTATADERDHLYSMHVNYTGDVIDFGSLRTNGSVLLRREGNEWVLRTLPRDRAFTLQLSTARFARPAAIRCDGGATETVVPNDLGTWWAIPLNGAQTYRWPAT